MKNLLAVFLILISSVVEASSLVSNGDDLKIYIMQMNSFGWHRKGRGYFESSKNPFRYLTGVSAGIKWKDFNFGPYWQISPTGFARGYRVVSAGNEATLATESFYVRTWGLALECNPEGFILGIRVGSVKSVKATYVGAKTEKYGTYAYDRALMVNPYIGFEIPLGENSDDPSWILRFSADFQFYNLKNREIDGLLFVDQEQSSNKRIIQNNLFYGLNISVIKRFGI